MPSFRRLPGLPPYGGPPQPFPLAWGRLGREGVVVEFVRSDGGAWAGNFALGAGGVSDVVPHPDDRHALVLAGGDAWVVDPDAATAERVATGVDALWRVEAPAGVVFSLDRLAFSRFGPTGAVWHSRRLSWDGFADVAVSAGQLTGLAWDALGAGWVPFAVDLATGAATGGAYGSADHEGWERLAGSAPGV